jgi:hypothetical protein
MPHTHIRMQSHRTHIRFTYAYTPFAPMPRLQSIPYLCQKHAKQSSHTHAPSEHTVCEPQACRTIKPHSCYAFKAHHMQDKSMPHNQATRMLRLQSTQQARHTHATPKSQARTSRSCLTHIQYCTMYALLTRKRMKCRSKR